ncbi:XRE family transcriptional regulator [Cereibacter sp. SYSU M97828]|nr:XRE family transcriptional regulator [Cereibacter flavus]
MHKKTYANTDLARYLERRVLELKPKKTQGEIAVRAGFTAVNMMSMIKSGATKLPLDRAPDLADALECDRAYLMLLALDQAVGKTAAAAIAEVFGTPVTTNEQQWLEELREVSSKTDPRMTVRLRAAFRAIF